MELFSIIRIVGSVLPVYDRIKSLALRRSLILLRDSLTRLPKSQLHAWIGGTILYGFEEEGVVAERF